MTGQVGADSCVRPPPAPNISTSTIFQDSNYDSRYEESISLNFPSKSNRVERAAATNSVKEIEHEPREEVWTAPAGSPPPMTLAQPRHPPTTLDANARGTLQAEKLLGKSKCHLLPCFDQTHPMEGIELLSAESDLLARPQPTHPTAGELSLASSLSPLQACSRHSPDNLSPLRVYLSPN
jgi:hypothetical protein